MEEFGAAIADVGVSQHSTYIDRDGNIAYWMTGFDPVRAPGVDPLFPRSAMAARSGPASGGLESHDEEHRPGLLRRLEQQGDRSDYNNATNNYSYYFGPSHRAHVIEDYLSRTR